MHENCIHWFCCTLDIPCISRMEKQIDNNDADRFRLWVATTEAAFLNEHEIDNWIPICCLCSLAQGYR